MKVERIIQNGIQTGIVALLCAFVGVLYVSLHDNVVKAGDGAPQFSIKTINGKTVGPKDFGGKLLILNFWATWCQPCVQEVPSLDALQRELGPKGLVVLGVSVDKDQKAYQEFLDRFHVSYLTAIDPNQAINTKYGTLQFPESYLIDTNGKVVEKIVGEANWSSEQMVQHVQSLL
ncbi:MAG TPA: TlpA disulfide reductase family protein [Bryobacteraceae bacterium]|jgi:peroxiredoxin|nr:TlpA disulfide reductase family protein [Bryobacteraceae bacterium]